MSMQDYVRKFAAKRSDEELDAWIQNQEVASVMYEDLLDQGENLTTEYVKQTKNVNDAYLGVFREEQSRRRNK